MANIIMFDWRSLWTNIISNVGHLELDPAKLLVIAWMQQHLGINIVLQAPQDSTKLIENG